MTRLEISNAPPVPFELSRRPPSICTGAASRRPPCSELQWLESLSSSPGYSLPPYFLLLVSIPSILEFESSGKIVFTTWDFGVLFQVAAAVSNHFPADLESSRFWRGWRIVACAAARAEGFGAMSCSIEWYSSIRIQRHMICRIWFEYECVRSL